MTVSFTSFQDDELTLPRPNGDIDVDVDFATPDFDANKNGVLSFEANPTSGNPTLQIKINGTEVSRRTFGNNVERTVQENFSQSILEVDNTLTMRVTGSGSVSASDFHVLYKAV